MSSFAHDSRELAQAYDQASEAQLEDGQRLVERLTLAAGARVLDVGCGTGRLTRWTAQRLGEGGSVTGIDPLEERVRLARSHETEATFAVGRGEDLGAFADESFDAVYLSSVLHWIADKATALREAHRVLRPGGRLGLTLPPPELFRAGTLARTLEALFARAPYSGHVDASRLTFARGCTTTELLSLLVDRGFTLTELQVTRHARKYASGAALVAFIEASSFGTFLRPVPEALRASLRRDLVAAFDAQGGPDGVPSRGWTTLVVATKS